MDDWVFRIQRAFPQIYLACHQEHGRAELSEREERILAHLHTDQGIGHGELARHLGVGAPTLSEALAALAARELVSRRRGARDRRQVELRLTARGRSALSDNSVLSAQRLGVVLGRLSERERASAVEGIEILAEAARATGKPIRTKEKK